MTAPSFYIVADGNAYAMEEDGYMFGAPVKMDGCLLYTSPSPRDGLLSRMPSSA